MGPSEAFQTLTEDSIQYHKPAKYRAKIPGYYDFPNFAVASQNQAKQIL